MQSLLGIEKVPRQVLLLLSANWTNCSAAAGAAAGCQGITVAAMARGSVGGAASNTTHHQSRQRMPFV